MEPMHVFFASAGSHWMVGALGLALVLVAALLNRFAPERKGVLRRALTWWGLYVGAALAHTLAGSAPQGLRDFLRTNTDLFQAFTLVSLASTLLFDVVLPALRFEVVRLTSDLLTGAAYAFVFAAVLSSTGLDLGSALAASTAAAAILTISLQSTLGNVVGGLALQVEGSVKVGDWIQLEGGRQGRVAEIHWRHTVLETRDGDTIVVPNATLLQGVFTLLGRRGGRAFPHRQWVYFHVDFRYAPSEVCRIVQDAINLAPIPNVVAEPAPDVVCLDLGREHRASFAVYALRYYILDIGPDEPTSSVLRGRIHAALRRAGIPLARPSETHFEVPQDDDAEGARQARRRSRARQALRSNRLFEPLTDEEADLVADRLIYAPFDAGETITRQGGVAHWLYVLASGSVEVVTEVDGVRRVVSRLQAPNVFGEMGLMTGEPRLASVVALTPVVCHRLEKQAFEDILRRRPSLAEAMAAILAPRRVQLVSLRENLSAEADATREHSERERILDRMRAFFGLE